ncbi:50S ribosomal protein L1 [Sedimentisphaera cyanobacteriorum]|uniref:Large ribosomal subunit protein uL1 n=1 Tax=Sedimentisphaera cyanobacteriorum TaxID=1940790 RepID=A0A1Q2HS71_9BACT|nr:50S ribosomal protein L1 [Sedimentisphaera cyanobacteriorum]AQQ10309.1 50S ribosomal protein L1 [Sedimentisphaera cyanobacteriorum]
MNKSRRYREAAEKAPKQPLSVKDAVEVLKGFSATKFDQSVDVVMHLGIDPRQSDQLIRGSLSLPNGIGKTKKVIAFCEDTEAEEAKSAGAVDAGGDELVEKVSGGWLDFDVAIASPKLMSKVGKLGRVLGPQGKMPSPKNGTVTPDVITAVKEFSAGKVEFRNDSGGNVHALVGKLSFNEKKLVENIKYFIDQIDKMKPESVKGTYIKKVCISSTMSPGVEIELKGEEK